MSRSSPGSARAAPSCRPGCATFRTRRAGRSSGGGLGVIAPDLSASFALAFWRGHFAMWGSRFSAGGRTGMALPVGIECHRLAVPSGITPSGITRTGLLQAAGAAVTAGDAATGRPARWRIHRLRWPGLSGPRRMPIGRAVRLPGTAGAPVVLAVMLGPMDGPVLHTRAAPILVWPMGKQWACGLDLTKVRDLRNVLLAPRETGRRKAPGTDGEPTPVSEFRSKAPDRAGRVWVSPMDGMQDASRWPARMGALQRVG